MPAATPTWVDPANVSQLAAWDGDEGAYWAAHADAFDRSLAAYHEPFLATAGIVDGDHVLDLACGTGQTTRDAARRTPSGSGLGVDLSSAMLEVATARAASEGLVNVRFAQADAQVHGFEPGHFDVALSRTGAMFFSDKVAAFSNIARSLRPGGRLVLLTWQPFAEQEWMQEIAGALAAGRERPAPPPDGPGPFSLSEPDRVRGFLEAAGFTDVSLTGAGEDMWFGDDVPSAHAFVLGLQGWMLDGLADDARAAAIDALGQSMESHLTDAGVVYGSAAWTVTATTP